jgi:hypothetical protein
MKPLLLAFIATILCNTSFAQDIAPTSTIAGTDTIRIKRSFWGAGYYYKSKEPLTLSRVWKLTKTTDSGRHFVYKAKVENIIGNALGFAGGIIVGWQMSKYFYSVEPDWTIVGLGGGLVALSLPFNIASFANTRKSVQYYNKHIQSTGTASVKPSLHLGYSGNSVGLALRF